MGTDACNPFGFRFLLWESQQLHVARSAPGLRHQGFLDSSVILSSDKHPEIKDGPGATFADSEGSI
jgi:hypothetical protein